tara:strand:- start:234 stop:500 length:267 start_codon:yes stop_codon:yes gene_type:complete
MTDNLKLGQWNVICDRCGFEYKSSQLRKEWTGLRVCDGADTNECFEVRNPQDLLRGRKDQQATPWSRPEPAEIDVSPGSGNEVEPGDL